MALEQLQIFHQVRRILKAVAPDWRVFSTEHLEEGVAVIDSQKKTIEVAEGTEVYQAIAAVLFQIGHIVLRKNPTFNPLFGDGIKDWKGKDASLVKALSDLGQKADELAAQWAQEVFTSYWDVTPEVARQHIENYVWSKEQWKSYFFE